jgi:metal-responsive CopG/Arc/MetJ family transcriptional regulator
MRHKIPDDKKKVKTAISIDEKLSDLFEKYLEEKGISNRSRYIEELIRKDMESRGENTEREF